MNINDFRKWIKEHSLEIFWLLYGGTIVNPMLPDAPKSILFVCKGNICRSPFAEHLATKLLHQGNAQQVLLSSAGLTVRQPESSPSEAVEAAKRFSINLDGHTSRNITLHDVSSFDMIIAMEASHINILKLRFPRFRGKFFLLPLFDESMTQWNKKFLSYNIADPYGKNTEQFYICYLRIALCLKSLFDSIAFYKTV